MKNLYLIIFLCLPLFLHSQIYHQEIQKSKQIGDSQYEIFTKECDKAILEGVAPKSADYEVMYDALMYTYQAYTQLDILAQKVEDSHMGANIYVELISERLLQMRSYFINAGVYYNENKEYIKASAFFQAHWDYQYLRVFTDYRAKPLEMDDMDSIIKYYAVVSAIQGKDSELSVNLLKRLISEPYIQNETYKESDPYELLAAEYQKTGQNDLFLTVLEIGCEKFPKNAYFMPNLANEYIKDNRTDEVLILLDKLLENNPASEEEYLNVKANLYIHKSDFESAKNYYNIILEKNKSSIYAIQGLGVLYVLQAQKKNEEASGAASRREQVEIDKEVSNLYLKALPYFEKFYELATSSTQEDNSVQIRQSLLYLQNVYYNLIRLGIDKEQEFEQIEKLLNDYSY